MLKSFTFVRMRPGLSRDEFFRRWCVELAPLGPVMRQDLENLPRVQKGLAQPGLRAVGA